MNEVVALLCSGLRKLELQRSISARLGFISQEDADREASLSYDQALEYIEENVK